MSEETKTEQAGSEPSLLPPMDFSPIYASFEKEFGEDVFGKGPDGKDKARQQCLEVKSLPGKGLGVVFNPAGINGTIPEENRLSTIPRRALIHAEPFQLRMPAILHCFVQRDSTTRKGPTTVIQPFHNVSVAWVQKEWTKIIEREKTKTAAEFLARYFELCDNVTKELAEKNLTEKDESLSDRISKAETIMKEKDLAKEFVEKLKSKHQQAFFSVSDLKETIEKTKHLLSAIFWANAVPGAPASEAEIEDTGMFTFCQQNNDTTMNSSKHVERVYGDLLEEMEDEEDLMLCIGTIPRFNHSCAPNAGFVWRKSSSDSKGNGSSGYIAIRAIRDILPNEEITVSYMTSDDMESGRPKRQAWTKQVMGFECGCQVCQEENARMHDLCLAKMKQLQSSIKKCMDETDHEKFLKAFDPLALENLLTLYKDSNFFLPHNLKHLGWQAETLLWRAGMAVERFSEKKVCERFPEVWKKLVTLREKATGASSNVLEDLVKGADLKVEKGVNVKLELCQQSACGTSEKATGSEAIAANSSATELAKASSPSPAAEAAAVVTEEAEKEETAAVDKAEAAGTTTPAKKSKNKKKRKAAQEEAAKGKEVSSTSVDVSSSNVDSSSTTNTQTSPPILRVLLAKKMLQWGAVRRQVTKDDGGMNEVKDYQEYFNIVTRRLEGVEKIVEKSIKTSSDKNKSSSSDSLLPSDALAKELATAAATSKLFDPVLAMELQKRLQESREKDREGAAV